MNKGTYTYDYPRPAVTTDCVIFGFDSEGLSVLLIEAGLEADYIEHFGTFTEVNRDPRGRVVTIAYFALVKKTEVKGADDAAPERLEFLY